MYKNEIVMYNIRVPCRSSQRNINQGIPSIVEELQGHLHCVGVLENVSLMSDLNT